MLSNSLQNLKILIIEDDEFLRDLFVMKLKKEGSEVLEAVNGEEALKKIQEIKPDLILLDIVLPRLDGFEVLKIIKKDSKLSEIPVILLTNLGQKDDVDRGLSLGANAYIIKAQFTPSEVVKKIKEVLSGLDHN